MAVVVENAMDQVAAAQNGGVFPIPPEVAADRAAQEKASGKGADVDKPGAAASEVAKDDEKPKASAEGTEAPAAGDDDTPGEDGLTPKQKREYTKSMLATIAKKHRAQKEAEELATRQYNERILADQRAENLARELEALKAANKPVVTESKLPQREAFKSDQEYWDAMVDYRVENKLQQERQQRAAEAEERRQAEIKAAATARIDRAKELVSDFEDVVAAMDTSVPPYVASYMQESELFAELGYHFAQNPAVLEKLASYTDGLRQGSAAYTQGVTRQLVALGKIESTLQPFAPKSADGSRETKEPKPSTETGSAPSKPRITAPIIKPLNGGSASQVQRDEADMTGSQVITAWQKKHGVNLTARKRH